MLQPVWHVEMKRKEGEERRLLSSLESRDEALVIANALAAFLHVKCAVPA